MQAICEDRKGTALQRHDTVEVLPEPCPVNFKVEEIEIAAQD